MATNQKLPASSNAPPSRKLPCGVSWMSANSETGPMPGGGGGSPQGCTASGAGAPASPVPLGAAGGDCADAAPTDTSAPENASETAKAACRNLTVMMLPPKCFRATRNSWQHGY